MIFRSIKKIRKKIFIFLLIMTALLISSCHKKEIADLKARIAFLEEENADLRKQLDKTALENLKFREITEEMREVLEEK